MTNLLCLQSMIRLLLNRLLYSLTLIIVFSSLSYADNKENGYVYKVTSAAIPDSTGRQQKSNPDVKENKGKKDDIKEVPKSRKQAKPATVKQQPIKIKPVKIAKPKVKLNMRGF